MSTRKKLTIQHTVDVNREMLTLPRLSCRARWVLGERSSGKLSNTRYLQNQVVHVNQRCLSTQTSNSLHPAQSLI